MRSEVQTRFAGRNLPPRPDAVSARNWDIFVAHLAGRTLVELARDHTISPPRVRQIVFGVADALEADAAREECATPPIPWARTARVVPCTGDVVTQANNPGRTGRIVGFERTASSGRLRAVVQWPDAIGHARIETLRMFRPDGSAHGDARRAQRPLRASDI